MPSCFVIMGFGEKSDPATGRKLNLDQTYKNVIKPAVASCGYDCVRADEIQHSGVIDVPMYEQLLKADLVIADLSTSNLNAIFELGIRHALRPRSTIVIAEQEFRSPFDVNHVVIRRYTHLGPDIGYDEVIRMQKVLVGLIGAIEQTRTSDSPVYIYVPGLHAPSLRTSTQGGISSSGNTSGPDDQETYAALFQRAVDARNKADFKTAKEILSRIYAEQIRADPGQKPNQARPRVIQELALATYKAADKDFEQSAGAADPTPEYDVAIHLLCDLFPEITTDPETLGLWSAIHKRKAELPGATRESKLENLSIAILAAERGFLIRNDYYTGGNLAYLLNFRATLSEGNDAVTDRTLASRVRRRIVDICRQRLDFLEKQNGKSLLLSEEAYWTQASLGEALTVLGDPAGAEISQDAFSRAPFDWMVDVTKQQTSKLMNLLKD
jgi:Tetratricopeptide Repeats-Sensor